MTMTADGKGAVFDVDSKAVDQFMSKCGDSTASGGHLIVPSTLPDLKHKVNHIPLVLVMATVRKLCRQGCWPCVLLYPLYQC